MTTSDSEFSFQSKVPELGRDISPFSEFSFTDIHGTEEGQLDSSRRQNATPGKSQSLPLCRICGNTKYEKDVSMIFPCRCRGDEAFAHRECLKLWVVDREKTSCQRCKTGFHAGAVFGRDKDSTKKHLFHAIIGSLVLLFFIFLMVIIIETDLLMAESEIESVWKLGLIIVIGVVQLLLLLYITSRIYWAFKKTFVASVKMYCQETEIGKHNKESRKVLQTYIHQQHGSGAAKTQADVTEAKFERVKSQSTESNLSTPRYLLGRKKENESHIPALNQSTFEYQFGKEMNVNDEFVDEIRENLDNIPRKNKLVVKSHEFLYKTKSINRMSKPTTTGDCSTDLGGSDRISAVGSDYDATSTTGLAKDFLRLDNRSNFVPKTRNAKNAPKDDDGEDTNPTNAEGNNTSITDVNFSFEYAHRNRETNSNTPTTTTTTITNSNHQFQKTSTNLRKKIPSTNQRQSTKQTQEGQQVTSFDVDKRVSTLHTRGDVVGGGGGGHKETSSRSPTLESLRTAKHSIFRHASETSG